MKTILVIEDNAENLYLVRYLLERSGYCVLAADNGPDGLKAAMTERPDLVLMDIGLPRMDGYEVTRKMQQDPATAAIPVVAFTAHAMAGDRARAFTAGCTGHIEKPLDPSSFVQEIEAYLSPPPRGHDGDHKGREMKVLVVDDHPQGRYLLEVVLRARGWQAVCTADGVAALEQLRSEGFDLVISDLLMPRMDGLRLRHEMMNDDKLRDIPFVLYTANLDRFADEASLVEKMGRTVMVAKPIEPADLVRKIEEVLATRESSPPSSPPVLAEAVFLKEYNEKLVHRLEDSNLQLEQANRALRESEARFRDFAEVASDWLWETDAELRFTFFSERTSEILGLDREEMLGRCRAELASSDDRIAYPEKWARHFADLEAHRPFRNFEYCVKENCRGVITIRVGGKPVFDAEGRFKGYRGIGSDVTAELQAKTALAESEQRFRELYHENPSMYLTLGPHGEIVSINQFGAQQLGYRPEELTGKSVANLLAEASREQALARIALSDVASGDVAQWEEQLLRKNQTVLWARISARHRVGGDGSVKTFVVCEDVTETRQLAEQLSFQAAHDVLTGLPNRRAFEKRMAHAIESARAGLAEHVVCYMDLDQFKVVNDTCGHAAGDELLLQLIDVLRGRMRERDMLARLGGDEFGLLLEYCKVADALTVVEDLRKSINEFRFKWEDRLFRVATSIGLVSLDATSEDLSEAMSAADAACYTAKEEGGNRVHVHKREGGALSCRQGEMHWVSRINQALEDNRFELWAQHVEALGADAGAAGEHFELLIRMRDENGEIVLPGRFLPAAERYQLAPRLDRWVIDTALGWLRSQPGLVDRVEQCSINLSGRSLSDDEFLRDLIGLLKESQLAGKICFEVTETAAITNLRNATQFMTTLQLLGSRFSLDDFGSGLSSFAYLKNLPVDNLKIDGQFVRNMIEDVIDHAMVKSIVQIARAMGKKTTAEFVESEAILRELQVLGVDYAQGYFIARPVPLGEFERLLRTRAIAARTRA